MFNLALRIIKVGKFENVTVLSDCLSFITQISKPFQITEDALKGKTKSHDLWNEIMSVESQDIRNTWNISHVRGHPDKGFGEMGTREYNSKFHELPINDKLIVIADWLASNWNGSETDIQKPISLLWKWDVPFYTLPRAVLHIVDGVNSHLEVKAGIMRKLALNRLDEYLKLRINGTKNRGLHWDEIDWEMVRETIVKDDIPNSEKVGVIHKSRMLLDWIPTRSNMVKRGYGKKDGENLTPFCLLCDQPLEEDLDHVTMTCSGTQKLRSTLWGKLIKSCSKILDWEEGRVNTILSEGLQASPKEEEPIYWAYCGLLTEHRKHQLERVILYFLEDEGKYYSLLKELVRWGISSSNKLWVKRCEMVKQALIQLSNQDQKMEEEEEEEEKTP